MGLIGCGAIGGTLARAIAAGDAGSVELVAICDLDKSRVERLSSELALPGLLSTVDPEDVIDRSDVQLVIEAASQETVRQLAEKVISSGKSMLIMSVGALSDERLLSRLESLARERKVKIYVPSGAVCGLDGVKAASIQGVTSVEIMTTKHPKSLEGAPYLVENRISLDDLTEPKTVFQGTARDAARGFPMNINVAVSLSLAGIGVDRTMVRIVADPHSKRTRHEIRVRGDFGELYTSVSNFVHPENPKTSYLAPLSAIRTLRSITEPLQIGS